MTGNELKQRREALGFTVEDLAREFDTLPAFIETCERFDQVPDGRILSLALDQIEARQEEETEDAAHDALMARVAESTARTESILAGRRVDPPTPHHGLILAAQEAVKVIDQSIAIMRHKGELPKTLQGLTQSRERLNKAIEEALKI